MSEAEDILRQNSDGVNRLLYIAFGGGPRVKYGKRKEKSKSATV